MGPDTASARQCSATDSQGMRGSAISRMNGPIPLFALPRKKDLLIRIPNKALLGVYAKSALIALIHAAQVDGEKLVCILYSI